MSRTGDPRAQRTLARSTPPLAAFLGALLLGGCCEPCGGPPPDAPERGVGVAERAAALPPEIAEHLGEARAIAGKTLIVDTHIVAPYKLARDWTDLARAAPQRDFDWPRARRGGLDAVFMSIYIPAEVDAADRGAARAEELIGYVSDLVARAPRKFALARNPDELVRNFERGVISLPLGMENGGPIRELDDVAHWRARGIRYVTLTHSEANHIADSSYDEDRPWKGLSAFGRQLVPRLEDAGIMIDVSHLSDAAFWDVLEVARLPVLATHSSARHFVPGFERNMSDEMIRAVAEQGGVVHINFGSTFVSAASRASRERRSEALERYLASSGVERDSAAAERWLERYDAEHPFAYAALGDVLAHFDHVVEIAGVEHVGVGSDFDGVGDTLPQGLKDVASYPHLIAGLLARGYDRGEIEAMLSGNLLRVWRQVEAHRADASAGDRDGGASRS